MRVSSFRRGHREAEVSTDSLNDIMFFLLLFFLILSTMVSPNAIKINLASSQNKKPINAPNNKPVHLAVTNDRKYYVDNKEVTLDNMESVIAQKIQGQTEPSLVMHLDKDLSIQDEVDILQICDRLKMKPILATKATHGK